MAFKEVVLPEEISAWLVGGPQWETMIGGDQGAYEQRTQLLVYPIHKWDGGTAMRELRYAQSVKAFQMRMRGRLYGFRMKDPLDNSAPAALTLIETGTSIQGVLATAGSGAVSASGVGEGLPSQQLAKLYVTDGDTFVRRILKPVLGSVVLYRNGSAMTAGTGAGNYALDPTTGLATYVADASAGVSSITVGATTQVTLASALSGLAGGGLLYLSGLAGADAALVNGLAHTINSVAGAVYTLATNTAGKTITAGSGVGAKHMQPGDVMTASFDFHVPVRFDNDWLRLGVDSGGLLNWEQISLVELRNPG